MSGAIPGAGETAVNQMDTASCLHGVFILVGEIGNREDKEVQHTALELELKMLKRKAKQGRGVEVVGITILHR